MADDNNPWQRKPEGPPDLIKLLKKFFSANNTGPDGGGNAELSLIWIWALVGFAVLIWLLSGIYIVNQAEQAVVLTFGKYAQTVGPGPHWIPQLISSERKVDIQQIRNFKYQTEMLTEDENIVNVSLAVQYRIDDPRAYLFNVVNPSLTLQQSTASALRQIVGSMTLDTILTTGRVTLTDQVASQLNKTIANYNMGLQVTDVRLLPARPPEAVTEAFDDAIKAREDKKSYINKGEAYARKVTSEVVGTIAKLTQSADAYGQQVILQAQGDVARYKALLKPYLAAPNVTRERLYLDTVQEVLSKTHNVIVDSSSNNVLYLPLNQLIKQHIGTGLANEQEKLSQEESTSASVREAKARVEDIINKGLHARQRPSYSSSSYQAGDRS